MNPVFTIENMRPIRDGMTVSRDSRLGTVNKITYFSMGAGTSISQESYDRMTMYITDAGSGTFLLGEEPKNVFATPGTALIVPEKTLWQGLSPPRLRGAAPAPLFLKRRTL